MIKYYKVIIDESAKDMGHNNEGYKVFNQATKDFATIKEVKKWLEEKYQNVKRIKMYQDKKDGTTYQTGWIYCYKNKDWSHDSNWWWQQDWVGIREVKEKMVLI